MHRGNAIIAWSAAGGSRGLPKAKTVTASPTVLQVEDDALRRRLSDEVQKILSAGHLRPGFDWGYFAQVGKTRGDNFQDYWAYPWDIIYTLTMAYPHLPDSMRPAVQQYLANEYKTYPPYGYTYTGYANGANRNYFDLPPEVEAAVPGSEPTMYSTYNFPGWNGPDWKWPPQMFYAVWKYAEQFGNAAQVFNEAKVRLYRPPADSVFATYPFALNAYIAGYHGYLQLKDLAKVSAADPFDVCRAYASPKTESIHLHEG